MREFKRGNKPVIHSSDIWNYFTFCPHSVLRHQEIPYQSELMWKGLMLESLAIGWKDDERNKDFIRDRIIYGTSWNKNGSLPKPRRTVLLDLYKESKVVKPYIKKGQPFERIEVEFSNYILTGEMDNNSLETIQDLKRAKNFEYWDEKTTFPALLQLLQSVYYPYLWFLKTKEIKPFEYVVYSYEFNRVKVYRLDNPHIMFRELADKIARMVNDIFQSPRVGEHCDIGGYNGCRPKCKKYFEEATKTKYFEFETIEELDPPQMTEKDIELLYGELPTNKIEVANV